MAIRPIICIPDPILRVKCEPVLKIDDEIRTLMDDMLETMYEAPGIGLAAIQIAIPKRVVVMDLAKSDLPPEPRVFVNPEIIWSSPETRPQAGAQPIRPSAWRQRLTRPRATVATIPGAGLR